MNENVDLSLLAGIGDILTDGILLFDLKKKHVLYINPSATAMTGIQRDNGLKEIAQRWKQVNIHDRAYLISQFQEILAEPVSRSAEFGMLRDGQKETFLHALACVVSERNILAVFLSDITRMKKHEDYLVEFGIKKNTLLDTLTHNLSGSLNLTRHLAKQAKKYADQADKEVQSYLGLITENAATSLKVIEDFVVFEYDKAPRIHIKLSRINLVQKVGFIYEQLQNSYPDRKFELIADLPELYVTTDEVKVLQVMNNLAANALKFSTPESLITFRIHAEDEHAVISVEDQGIGIPDSLKPLIFLRQPTTGRPGLNGEPSNGNGLSICKHLIELVHGNIWFDSTENTGTKFFISLPYALSTAENQGGVLGQ